MKQEQKYRRGVTMTITFALTARLIICCPLNMLKRRHNEENHIEPMLLI